MTKVVTIVIDSCTDVCLDNSESIKTEVNYYHNILSCLGYQSSKPPVADLLRRLHGLDGTWLVVSPIYLQATHNDVMILATGEDLQLTPREGRAWFSAFSESVLAENMKLHYHDASTWLMQASDFPPIESKPVHSLLHKSIMEELSTLDPTLYWQRFITESQMFLSSHPLNTDRKNRYPINGLWIWGNGILQEPISRPIVIDEPIIRHLADLLSTNVSLLSDNDKIIKNTLILMKNNIINNKILANTAGNLELTCQKNLNNLQQCLKKQTIFLYWNNVAYKIKSKNWLKRLFGVIFNVN